MQKVAILTDSSACIPKEIAEKHHITVIPVDLVFENRVFRDGLDNSEDFYKLLSQAKKLPTTSAPTPGAFLEAFTKASEWAQGIICFTLPANLSSMHNSARQARELAIQQSSDVRIEIVAAGAVAAGQGLIAIEAAKAAANGADVDGIMELAKGLNQKVHFFAMLDTLEYLAKGGRVPRAAAWVGKVIGFKPILTAVNGEVKLMARTRTKQKALDRMLHFMEQRVPNGSLTHVAVMHANARADADELQKRVESKFKCADLFVTRFTPVMGAHSGPGVVGVAFYS